MNQFLSPKINTRTDEVGEPSAVPPPGNYYAYNCTFSTVEILKTVRGSFWRL
jgi:hypothetical protein